MRITNDFRVRCPLLLLLTCGLIAVIGMGSLGAQDSAPAPAPGATAAPSVAEIEALLAAVEPDTAMAAELKDSLKTKYKEAIENLKKAEADAAQGIVFRNATESAPVEISTLGAERRALLAPEDEAKRLLNEEPEDLQGVINSRRDQLEEREEQLRKTESQLVRIGGRPDEITALLKLARASLSQTETQLVDSDLSKAASSVQLADRFVLLTKRDALGAEIGMLEQERSTLDLQEDRILARRDLLLRQVENDQSAVKALTKLEGRELLSASDQFAKEIARLLVVVGSSDEDQAVKKLVAEMPQLAKDHKDAAKHLIKINEDFEDTSEKLTSLSGEFERIEAELALGGLEGTFGQVLAGMRRRLPNANAFAYSLDQRRGVIREMRLALVRVERKLDEQLSLEEEVSQNSASEVAQLVKVRGTLLDELRANYRNLERKLSRLDAAERAYQKKIIEVQDFLQEETFFSRSSSRVNVNSFTDIPAGLRWFAGLDRWQELGRRRYGSSNTILRSAFLSRLA